MTAPLTIALFVIGIYALAWYATLYRAFVRRRAQVEWAWQETMDLLTPRGERALFLARTVETMGVQEELADEVKEAYRLTQAAPSREDRIRAEQELSHFTLALIHAAGHDQRLSTRGDLSDLVAELEERERLVARARERYNEAASALNVERRSFPGGLLVRALYAELVPLFEGAQ